MINLSRSLEVRCVDVAATVAVEQDRPEFLAIVQLAKDLGGEISPQQVQHELFRPFPEHVCHLALDRCVGLKMLDRNGGAFRLNELGGLAIETGKVLVAEQGVWRFHLTDDPLVPFPVVHAERIKTEAVHKDLSKQKNGEEDYRGDFSIRSLLCDSVDVTPQRSLADSKLRQIREVGNRGHECGVGIAKLELIWPEDGPPKVLLTGQLPKSEHRLDAVTEPDLDSWTYDKLWMELAAEAASLSVEVLSDIKVRLGKRKVPVSADTVEPEGKKTFRRDFSVPKMSLQDIGSFLPTTLNQVDILPATDRDAQDWCEWLQWNEITGYVTPEMLRAQAASVLARFPHHRPSPLEPSTMRTKALLNNNRSEAHHVLAPADLGLWS